MGLTEAGLQSGWGGGQGVGQERQGPSQERVDVVDHGLWTVQEAVSPRETKNKKAETWTRVCVGVAKEVSREDGRLWSKNGRRE